MYGSLSYHSKGQLEVHKNNTNEQMVTPRNKHLLIVTFKLQTPFVKNVIRYIQLLKSEKKLLYYGMNLSEVFADRTFSDRCQILLDGRLI